MQEPDRISILDQTNAPPPPEKPSAGSVLVDDEKYGTAATAGKGSGSGSFLIVAALVPLLLIGLGGYFVYKAMQSDLPDWTGSFFNPSPPPSLPTISKRVPDEKTQPQPEAGRKETSAPATPATTAELEVEPEARADAGGETTSPKTPERATDTDGSASSGASKQDVHAEDTTAVVQKDAPAAPAADDSVENPRPQIQRGAASAEQANSIKTWRDRGIQAIQEKNWAEVIANYDMVIALDASTGDYFNDRGLAYYELKQYERARNDLIWALALEPNNKFALFNLGLLNFDTGKNAASEENFGAYLKLDSSDAEAWRRRGTARYRQKNYAAAIQDFSKAVELDPKDGYAFAFRCGAKIELGATKRVEDDCEQALKLVPDMAEALNNLAWLHYRRREYSKGLPFAERAVKADRTEAAYWDTRGHLLEGLGEKDLAISDFRSALKRNPQMQESIEGLRRLGVEP